MINDLCIVRQRAGIFLARFFLNLKLTPGLTPSDDDGTPSSCYPISVGSNSSAQNLELVRTLGADHLVDYTQEDVVQNGQRYDLILDNVGNPAMYQRLYQHSLSSTGIYVVVAGSFSLQLFRGPWMSMLGGNKIGTYMTKTKREDLIYLRELLETGKLVPVIDRQYPLHEIPEAMRCLEGGHARGKVVISE